MVPVLSLWLPILVSTILVFAVSSLIHMVLKYHASDYAPVTGGEEAVAEALRPLPPGQYSVPWASSMKEMGEPEFEERIKRGPVALMVVRRPGSMGMGTALVTWLLYALVVSIFAAYITGRALGPGAEYLSVFRFAGTTAFVAYAVGGWQESIWFGRPWRVTLKNTLDGVFYAAVTAGSFGWLWPGG
jgi:hypothetical protein